MFLISRILSSNFPKNFIPAMLHDNHVSFDDIPFVIKNFIMPNSGEWVS